MCNHICQIASLKAALARKEGEAEQFNNGGNETPKHKSYASSPPVTRPSSGGSRKLSKDDSSSLDVSNMLLTLIPAILQPCDRIISI